MKIIYIAHPIGGDVQNNIKKVLAIVRDLNLTRTDIVPCAPYVVDVQALDDATPYERARGIANNTALISRGIFDEIWLYGDKISEGMINEIALFERHGLKVVPKSEEIIKMSKYHIGR